MKRMIRVGVFAGVLAAGGPAVAAQAATPATQTYHVQAPATQTYRVQATQTYRVRAPATQTYRVTPPGTQTCDAMAADLAAHIRFVLWVLAPM